MKIALAAAISTLLLIGDARAAECVLHLKRIPCPGQEAQAYERCAGRAECDFEDAATTAPACSAAANRECANDRIGVTKFKVVIGTFQGVKLNGGFAEDGAPDPAGVNFCSAGRPDMYRCK